MNGGDAQRLPYGKAVENQLSVLEQEVGQLEKIAWLLSSGLSGRGGKQQAEPLTNPPPPDLPSGILPEWQFRLTALGKRVRQLAVTAAEVAKEFGLDDPKEAGLGMQENAQ